MKHNKKIIPYGRQSIQKEDIKAVIKVLKNNNLTQGPKVTEFEQVVITKVGAKFGVAVNSATSGLHLACLALNLQKEDWLWTSPITFVASANCGRYCGANVGFIDIDESTGLMCIKNLRKKLKEAKHEGNLPKIIIPVHLAGNSCDMKEIWKLSKMYGFRIIEDASHAIGGKYRNKYIGCCKYSDITIFSFHPVKIITTGEGGMAVTNNKEISIRMRKLRSHGITKERKEYKFEPEGEWSYEQHELGHNYRMTDIQATLGIEQMKRLDSFVKKRNKILKRYSKKLDGEHIRMIKPPNGVDSAVHLAIAVLKNKSKKSHKIIFKKLRKYLIGVQLHYSPIHLQPYYRELGHKPGDYENAEAYEHVAISLPVFPKLKRKEQKYVIKILNNLVKMHK